MSLAEVVQNIGTFGLAGATVVVVFGAGYFYRKYTERIESIASRPVEEPTGASKSTPGHEDYEPRSIKEAMDIPGARSTVTGRVKRWTPALDSYSGVLMDDSGEAPFHFCECVMDSEGRGVIPEILAHSFEKQRPVIMDVESTEVNPILRVQRIEYEMNGRKYEI